MEKAFSNPTELPDWQQFFSQVISVSNQRKTVYISGQVSVDNQKKLIGKNDLKKQAMQAFKNLATALASTGATTADVVKLNIYVKNYKRADASTISEAVSLHFPFENKPTATWIGVQTLADEDFLIEVDAIAVII